jgi:hypothetical protein
MHTRSTRVQTAVIGLVVLSLALSGSAYSYATGSTVSWLDRDRITVSVGEWSVSAEDAEVTTQMTLDNPTGRPITVKSGMSDLVLYRGPEPSTDAAQLTTPRTVSFRDTTVPAGESRTITVRLGVPANGTERLTDAVAADNTTVSGRLYVRMGQRDYLKYFDT